MKKIIRKPKKDGSILYKEIIPFKYRIKQFFKSYWVIVFTVVMLMCAFTPQILEWVYPKFGIAITITNFQKEELLNFYGSYLAFLGTTILGVIVVIQNNQMRKKDEARNRPIIQFTKSKFYYDIPRIPDYPSVKLNLNTVENICNDDDTDSHNNISEIKLTFRNTSTQYTQVIFRSISRITRHNGEIIESKMGALGKEIISSLKPYEEMPLSIIIDNQKVLQMEGEFINIEFYLTNSYGEKYIEKLELVIAKYYEQENEFEIWDNGVLEIKKVTESNYVAD